VKRPVRRAFSFGVNKSRRRPYISSCIGTRFLDVTEQKPLSAMPQGLFCVYASTKDANYSFDVHYHFFTLGLQHAPARTIPTALIPGSVAARGLDEQVESKACVWEFAHHRTAAYPVASQRE
jgi:hypothetical protein